MITIAIVGHSWWWWVCVCICICMCACIRFVLNILSFFPSTFELLLRPQLLLPLFTKITIKIDIRLCVLSFSCYISFWILWTNFVVACDYCRRPSTVDRRSYHVLDLWYLLFCFTKMCTFPSSILFILLTQFQTTICMSTSNLYNK